MPFFSGFSGALIVRRQSMSNIDTVKVYIRRPQGGTTYLSLARVTGRNYAGIEPRICFQYSSSAYNGPATANHINTIYSCRVVALVRPCGTGSEIVSRRMPIKEPRDRFRLPTQSILSIRSGHTNADFMPNIPMGFFGLRKIST